MAWSLVRYSYLGAWSGTQGLELGAVLITWSLECCSCLGACSYNHVLELGGVLMFSSLEEYSGLELRVLLRFWSLEW